PGVEGVVGQPGELLLPHGAAAPTVHAPDLELQVHPGVAAREVAHPTGLAVVERPLHPPTGAAGRFFPRRMSRRIRALGSPKMPRTVASGRKPGYRPDCSRVGMWRGGLGLAYPLPALSVAGASIAWPCSVSTSRSSNPACGSPAPGSRTRT